MATTVTTPGQLNEAYLQSLKDSGVPESRTIEYKAALPLDTKDSKIEFLADVTAFANTSGGTLYIGIAEEGGIPTAVDGIAISDTDKYIQHLENLLRDGVQPRLSPVIECVPLASGNYVVVVKVQRSWARPHRVTIGGHAHFYERHSTGKAPMDVGQLRTAFLMADSVNQQAKQFRIDRVSGLLAGESPGKLRDFPKVILHIVPAVAFDPATRIDMSVFGDYGHSLAEPMRWSGGYSSRFNFDGALAYCDLKDELISYTQVFTNGIIEAVAANMLTPDGLNIPSHLFEEILVKSLRRYAKLLHTLELEPPYFVMLTLTGVKGFRMGVGSGYFSDAGAEIDRDLLLVPEILIENADFDPAQALRPIFDAVWNAAGWEGSLNYNEDGTWKLQA